MSCYLRVAGKEFDVDGFIAGSGFKDWDRKELDITYKGQKVPGSIAAYNGFQIHVSDTDFTDFGKQQQDALKFLSEYSASFAMLQSYSSDWCYLDFGVNGSPANGFCETYALNDSLMNICGELKVGIAITGYFAQGDRRRANRAARKLKMLRKRRD